MTASTSALTGPDGRRRRHLARRLEVLAAVGAAGVALALGIDAIAALMDGTDAGTSAVRAVGRQLAAFRLAEAVLLLASVLLLLLAGLFTEEPPSPVGRATLAAAMVLGPVVVVAAALGLWDGLRLGGELFDPANRPVMARTVSKALAGPLAGAATWLALVAFAATLEAEPTGSSTGPGPSPRQHPR